MFGQYGGFGMTEASGSAHGLLPSSSELNVWIRASSRGSVVSRLFFRSRSWIDNPSDLPRDERIPSLLDFPSIPLRPGRGRV